MGQRIKNGICHQAADLSPIFRSHKVWNGGPPDSHKLFSSLLDAGRMAQRFRALGIRPHLLTSATHTFNAHTYMQVKHSLRASMLHS